MIMRGDLMKILTIMLFVLSANADNLFLSASYSIKKVKISSSSMLIFAVISTLGTYLSMKFGDFWRNIIPDNFEKYIGSLILIAVGIWTIYETLKPINTKKSKPDIASISYNSLLNNPEKVDIDFSGTIDAKESILLGIVLTLNNMAGGIGAGIANVNIFITCILTFILSFIFIILGSWFGKKFSNFFSEKKGGILSGIIIILIGILILL